MKPLATVVLLLLAAPAAAVAAAVGPGTAPASPVAPAPAPPVQPVVPAPAGAVPAAADNVGEAQVPIVAGNVAGARERALDEALRRVLEQALARSFDEPTRTAQARKIKNLLLKPRRYVRRYRTLDEGEVAGGAYRIKVEAEVDEPTLRRELEKTTPTPLATSAREPQAGLALAGEGASEGVEAVAQALSAAGLKTVRPPAGQEARDWASRSGLPIAFVTAAATDEGVVRGPGLLAVSCRLAARIFGRQGAELGSESVARRAFAERPEVARAACFAPAASDLAAQILRGTGGELQGGSDLRTITIDAQLVDAAAVPALLKVLRGVGSASSVELRQVTAGHAEIRVKTRQSAPALLASAARDGAGALVLATVEISGDLARIRVTPVPPEAAAPAAPAPSSTVPVPSP